MRIWLSIQVMFLVALFAGAGQAATIQTTVDTNTRMVRLDFTGLLPYEQIRLEGVTALYWCNCVDSLNPSSLMSTSFTVNAQNLEMKYEGGSPPSTNYITYHYLDSYDFAGYETIDWVVVAETSAGDVRMTAQRPILVPVPEPSTALLCFVGLVLTGMVRRAGSPTGGRMIGISGTGVCQRP
jgi:hypothetical protein